MTVTAVSLCNMALARLGADQQISAIDATTSQSRACLLVYEQCRDELLRAHDWIFAERRVALAEDGTAPDPWTYQYRYPTDCLKIRGIDPEVLIEATDNRIPHDVTSDSTGRLILTDQADAILVYTVKITDTAQFPPDFASALAWKLATELAMPIAKSPALRDSSEQHYLLAVQRAITADSDELQRGADPVSEYQRVR
jgi:hypothetical protein